MREVQIAQNPKLVRDLNSKAILNTDRTALEEYYMKRELAKKQQAQQVKTEDRITHIENEMTEIKSLLRQLLQQRDVNGN